MLYHCYHILFQRKIHLISFFLFLAALKVDRKRLKSEKFDVLNQMKQLYATLEDKEKELREFIRAYEKVSPRSGSTIDARFSPRH